MRTFEEWKMDPMTCSDLPIGVFNDPYASRLGYEAWNAATAESRAEIERLRKAVKEECEQKVIAIEGALKLDDELSTLSEREKGLWEALDKLLLACLQADAIGELCEFVDGSMLDAARAALAASELMDGKGGQS